MTDHYRSSAGQPDGAASGNVPEVTNWTPAHHRITGNTANRLGALFYVAVAAVALAGQSLAAVHWLNWPLWLAVGATAVLELGGIALAARADFRRRLGERAYAARGLSAAVAAFAVVFNWVGHDDHLAGGFFAGMSALGYAVWLINAGDRRRDQLRAENKLPPTPPAYEVWHWLRHPMVTARARSLAKADPRLGLYGSLTAAVEQVGVERRERAIARILRKRFKKGDAADLAVYTYDLKEIARRIAAQADYDGLTELIAAELTAEKVAARPDTSADTLADTVLDITADMATDVGPDVGPDTDTDIHPDGPADTAAVMAADTEPDTEPDTGADIQRSNGRTYERTPQRTDARTSARTSKASDTATKADRLLARFPDMDAATLAKRLSVSDRQARRYIAARQTATPADDDQERHPEPLNGSDRHPDVTHLIGAIS